MGQVVPLIAAIGWGLLAPRLFFKAWISVLALVWTLLCLLTGRTPLWRIFRMFYVHFSTMLFFSLILFTGFYLLYGEFKLGRTHLEVLLFTVSATVQLFFVLPQISSAIDHFMEH